MLSNVRRVLAAAIGATLAGACLAQAPTPYPTKTVRMIVPYPVGQATDLAARLLADDLSRRWGQPVFVDNRVGGAGIPGMIAGKDAPADGYTVMLGTSAALVVNPAIFAKLPYDSFKDYVYVSGLFRNPLLIVANAASPYASLQQLVAAAKKAPGTINWGYPGTGNAQHLTGELFKSTVGVELTNIMYRGSAQAQTDLLGNQIPLAIDSVAATLPSIKSGKLKPLATTGAARAPQLPDVPTVAELGYPGFEGEGWGGIVVPHGTPADVVARIEAGIHAALNDPAFRAKLVENGLIPYTAGAAEFTKYAQSELGKWADVARRAQIQPQ